MVFIASRFCSGLTSSSSAASLRRFFAHTSAAANSSGSAAKKPSLFRRDVTTRRPNGDAEEVGSRQLFEFADARLVAFAADPKFAAVELIPREPNNGAGDRPLRLPLVWLRDHCRAPASYNASTNQRRADCTDLFARATLADDCYPISFDAHTQRLKLCWADGHESEFGAEQLCRWALFSKHQHEECAVAHAEGEEGGGAVRAADGHCPSRTLWDADTLRVIPSVSSTPFDFGLFARLFVRFGVVCVNGVDARDERATRQLCERIAPLFGTIFGDFWTFGPTLETQAGMESHDDTAYGNEAIGPHTDGTYLDQPPGIQVFHCLRPAVEGGGRTILVDGFAVAERMRAESPELFAVLSTTRVEHEYLESAAWHARAFREPVIRQFAQAEKIAQIRFNPYDRAPMRTLNMDEHGQQIAMEDTVLFYEAYQRYAQLVNGKAQQLHVALRPGTVLFIDNFRALHGRTAFQGERLMCGCYLNRDVLLAKARPVLSPNYYCNV